MKTKIIKRPVYLFSISIPVLNRCTGCRKIHWTWLPKGFIKVGDSQLIDKKYVR